MWRRLLLGAVLIVLASATATTAAGFREIDRVVTAFRDGEILDLGQSLAEAESGQPQTVMLIGSDERARDDVNFEDKSRSDTLILVRLDPARGATSILSLPRDLKVTVPGFGTQKLNAAYEKGGPKLALETVKRLTGLRINHVVNVDFDGFQRAVNAIGCVYVDIDRRYFNDNSGFGPGYETIDVPQGYQRLCGEDALDYVRYRHEDNDLVRAARQQEFLRQAKQQVSVGDLISDRQRLIEIFGRYTSSDIRSRAEVVQLVKLGASSAGRPVQEVHFKGEIGQTYVTASSSAIKKLTQDFLGFEATKGPRGKARSERQPRRPERPAKPRGDRPVAVEQAEAEGRLQGEGARGARLPVFYPTVRAPGSLFLGNPRVYALEGPDGRTYPSYRMTLKADQTGQYYGLQGTAWKDAPILTGTADEVRKGGRTFEVFRDGDRVRLVGWRTPQGVYWVSNTLLQTLSERQMLAIAESTRPL